MRTKKGLKTGVVDKVEEHDGDYRVILRGKPSYYVSASRNDVKNLKSGDVINFERFNDSHGWFISAKK
jgi:hypothetical protein